MHGILNNSPMFASQCHVMNGEAGHLQHAQPGVPRTPDGDTVESVDVEVEVSDIIFLLVSHIYLK